MPSAKTVAQKPGGRVSPESSFGHRPASGDWPGTAVDEPAAPQTARTATVAHRIFPRHRIMTVTPLEGLDIVLSISSSLLGRVAESPQALQDIFGQLDAGVGRDLPAAEGIGDPFRPIELAPQALDLFRGRTGACRVRGPRLFLPWIAREIVEELGRAGRRAMDHVLEARLAKREPIAGAPQNGDGAERRNASASGQRRFEILPWQLGFQPGDREHRGSDVEMPDLFAEAQSRRDASRKPDDERHQERLVHERLAMP